MLKIQLLHHRNELHFNIRIFQMENVILNCNNIPQYYCFYSDSKCSLGEQMRLLNDKQNKQQQQQQQKSYKYFWTVMYIMCFCTEVLFIFSIFMCHALSYCNVWISVIFIYMWQDMWMDLFSFTNQFTILKSSEWLFFYLYFRHVLLNGKMQIISSLNFAERNQTAYQY